MAKSNQRNSKTSSSCTNLVDCDICVSRAGDRLEPREFRESSDDDAETTDGYPVLPMDLLGVYVLLPE